MKGKAISIRKALSNCTELLAKGRQALLQRAVYLTSVNKPSMRYSYKTFCLGKSRTPARKRSHQNIPSDLVLDVCGVPGKGCVPTFCFSSASSAGNMLLLYDIRNESQSHRHPATTLARVPQGQLITQQKLKSQNRTTETPAHGHRAQPWLPQLPRGSRKPCPMAPFFLPSQRLAVPLLRRRRT